LRHATPNFEIKLTSKA